ncbi:MAG: hypothetical protein IPJ37_06425 [Bacteroidales bacterium]|nr:hypothetical protein [Bacteroidales bacterium]
MKTTVNEYNFNLFKPVSPYGRKNRNLIITLLIIWFVAIFGFQFLLLLVQKPTPEKTLITFESVWENIKTGSATVQEKMNFVNSLVAVAGKSSVKPENRIILGNALTWSVFSMVSDSESYTITTITRTQNHQGRSS